MLINSDASYSLSIQPSVSVLFLSFSLSLFSLSLCSLSLSFSLSQITDEEIERIMSGQEFKEEASLPEHTWSNNGDSSDHSSPSNGASEGNQPSPASTLSSKWVSNSSTLGSVVAIVSSLSVYEIMKCPWRLIAKLVRCLPLEECLNAVYSDLAVISVEWIRTRICCSCCGDMHSVYLQAARLNIVYVVWWCLFESLSVSTSTYLYQPCTLIMLEMQRNSYLSNLNNMGTLNNFWHLV